MTAWILLNTSDTAHSPRKYWSRCRPAEPRHETVGLTIMAQFTLYRKRKGWKRQPARIRNYKMRCFT